MLVDNKLFKFNSCLAHLFIFIIFIQKYVLMSAPKALFAAILLSGILNMAFAQGYVDTSLNFNQRYTQCERKWVALPRKDPMQGYTYGIVYIDEHAGFKFFAQGSFKIDAGGHYVAD